MMCFATSSFGFHLLAHVSCGEGFTSAREAAPSITRTSESTQPPARRRPGFHDPAPGYEGVILRSARYPDGHFLEGTDGQAAAPVNELAWRLDGGN